MRKILFTDKQIQEIKNYYLIENLSCEEIGKKFKVSKSSINRLLSNDNLLRKGFSNGQKINISNSDKEKIKHLYLDKHKSINEISKILKYSESFIDKHIQKSGYRRKLGESISLRQLGTKRSDKVKEILKNAQQKLVKEGKRKQTGGVCKRYVVNGIECFGTYEKFFIEKLIEDKEKLPKNTNSIQTPYGAYYPDFKFSGKLVEIKSQYTYNILLGNEINRYTKKIDKTQYEKIKWVNKNVKPIDIIVVDKRNNKLTKQIIN